MLATLLVSREVETEVPGERTARSLQSTSKPLAARPMTIRLSPARARGRMAAQFGVILLLTGIPQLYAQGRTATASLVLRVRPEELLQEQNGTTNSNTGQAVLHLTAIVVPIVMAPQEIPKNSSTGNVVVYLPSTQQVSDITSESHPLQDNAGAVLKTITVVSPLSVKIPNRPPHPRLP